MLFSRDIGYIESFYNGLKMATVGMIKWNRIEGECWADCFVKLDEPVTKKLKIYLEGKEGRFFFRELAVEQGNGKASWQKVPAEHITEEGGRYDELYGIYIPLEQGWYLAGRYREGADRNEPERAENAALMVTLAKEGDEEPLEVSKDEIEDRLVEEATEESAEDTTEEAIEIPQEIISKGLSGELHAESKSEENTTINGIEVTFGETKWDTLYRKLPKRIPFQDDRRFLELTMEDLLLLSEKNFRFCKNPFLLYGYKEYGHLLLGRIGQEKKYNYVLGVPGIYHPKEIQAAVNYGFESFEAVEKNQGKTLEGGKGYYFTKVSL